MIVGNASSRDFPLDDTVFQGTVLGPPLWNVFFEDVSTAVPIGFVEKKFADDLSCFKAFDEEVSNEDVHGELPSCQSAVHEWGKKKPSHPRQHQRILRDLARERGRRFPFPRNMDGHGATNGNKHP